MPRKKQLNLSASSITNFRVEIKRIKSAHKEIFIDVIHLEIHTDADVYRYEIRTDERAPDINSTRDYIEESLGRAKEEFLKVRIAEYEDRLYLFLDVQSIGQTQYTGHRV